MNKEIEELLNLKAEEKTQVIDLSITDRGPKYLTEEELKKYRRRQDLVKDVLLEMDCTDINDSNLHNLVAHVPVDYDANEYVKDVLNQSNVIFKVQDSEHILVNLDVNDVVLIKALSFVSLWRNNKNPYKKKEYRESNSN